MNNDVEIRFCCKFEDGYLYAFVADKWRPMRDWNKAWGPHPTSRLITERMIHFLAMNTWGTKKASELREKYEIILVWGNDTDEAGHWPWNPKWHCKNILVQCQGCGNPLGFGREVVVDKSAQVWHPKCWDAHWKI